MKASEIAILDVRKLTFITDFFLVATVSNERQARAIAEELSQAMRSRGHRAINPSPRRQAGWILMDFGDIVAHLFSPDLRKFYDIESLWADAPSIAWQSARQKK
ncbi:MAG: ribosome silencing factor [Planctomycetes bacterium RBG_16_59_8]|nr:MAG: ribosome silencing factor [Planctomycetes bacterium RBG_16_59_8]